MEPTSPPAEQGAQPQSAQTVLLVEDDRGLRESLATVLSFQGLTVLEAESAEKAKQLIQESDPDLVVLDVNLPGKSGLEFLTELRSTADERQVLLLTARHEVADRVAGLDAGADDYLPKPFALDEMLARVRLLLRRASAASSRTTDSAAGRISLGDFLVDRPARRVTWGGAEIDLTKREYELLELLATNFDTVLPRATIQERIWGYDEEFGSNILEALVSSLRKKLEAGGRRRVVHTVRGVGYVARLPLSTGPGSTPTGEG